MTVNIFFPYRCCHNNLLWLFGGYRMPHGIKNPRGALTLKVKGSFRLLNPGAAQGLRGQGKRPIAPPATINVAPLCKFQVLADFLLQLPEKFGIRLAQGRGFLGGGLPPVFPGGMAIPVILAQGLEGRTLPEEVAGFLLPPPETLPSTVARAASWGGVLPVCRGHPSPPGGVGIQIYHY